MIMKFLRENNVMAMILAVIRITLGWAWMTAGWGKITNGFDASGFLNASINNPVTGPDGNAVYGWWTVFLEKVALSNVELFNILVPWGEFLVGLGLVLGCLTTYAMFFGLVMNFSFFLSGTVSHNPTDILQGFIILVAGANAGKFGLDYYVLPYLKNKINFQNKKKPKMNTIPDGA